MSYEGTELAICTNGHLSQIGCYPEFRDTFWACAICASEIAWWAGIDQTNNAGVWPVLEIFTEKEVKKCEHCGAVSVINEIRYCIPSNFGHITKLGGELIGISVPIKKLEAFSAGGGISGGKRVFTTAGKATEWWNKREEGEPQYRSYENKDEYFRDYERWCSDYDY